MTSRRIVTANVDGCSVVDSDIEVAADAFASVPGFALTIIWGTQDGVDGSPGNLLPTILPPPGGSRFLIVSFPPDAVFGDPSFDGAAAAAEQQQRLRDLGATFEPEAPGMHRTHTIDYAIVLSGTPVLELDGGVKVKLSPGDTIVQQATRHAWRNPGDSPSAVAFVMIGNEKAQRG